LVLSYKTVVTSTRLVVRHPILKRVMVMDTYTRAAPILPENQIKCITDIIAEPRDYIEAQITELTTEVITTREEAPPATTDPPPAKVPLWFEQIEKRVPEGKTIERYTPVPGILIKRVKGDLMVVYDNNE
jgi:hypothetical protein